MKSALLWARGQRRPRALAPARTKDHSLKSVRKPAGPAALVGPRPSRPVCPEGLRGPRGPPPLGVGPGRALKEGTQAPDGKEPHREPRVPRVPGGARGAGHGPGAAEAAAHTPALPRSSRATRVKGLLSNMCPGRIVWTKSQVHVRVKGATGSQVLSPVSKGTVSLLVTSPLVVRRPPERCQGRWGAHRAEVPHGPLHKCNPWRQRDYYPHFTDEKTQAPG